MKRTIAVAAVMLSTGAALAHHGWSTYDAAKKFTISAPVETLSWSNPHGQMTVMHDGAMWTVILAPVSRMESRGLSETMLKVGALVAAEGYPSRVAANEMRAERVTVDGKTVELR